MPKKKWKKPELLCLTEGEVREAVLIICKNSSTGGPRNYGCMTGDMTSACENCFTS